MKWNCFKKSFCVFLHRRNVLCQRFFLLELKTAFNFSPCVTWSTIKPIHFNENTIYIFLFWELHGLSPNFHIHEYLSILYIPRIGPHIFLQQNRQIYQGNIHMYIAHMHMNVEIGTVDAQFLFWEYLLQIFGFVSLQCSVPLRIKAERFLQS